MNPPPMTADKRVHKILLLREFIHTLPDSGPAMLAAEGVVNAEAERLAHVVLSSPAMDVGVVAWKLAELGDWLTIEGNLSGNDALTGYLAVLAGDITELCCG